MDDLELSARDLAALRALMAMEPVPGQPLPAPAVLEKVHALVPCDELDIGYVDMTGLVTAAVTVTPAAHRNTVVVDLDLHEQHGGPFYLGVMHWRLHPAQAEGCGNFLGRREDALSIGFRNGTDHVVQYSFVRGTASTSPPGSSRCWTWSAPRSSGSPANVPPPRCRPR